MDGPTARHPAERPPAQPGDSDAPPGPPAPAGSAPALTETLRQSFGFTAFREGQEEAMRAVLAGRDAVVLWATGNGKSLVYQVPALHTGKTAVVVTPLVSLMQDQVHRINATAGRGERQLAAFLGSAQTDPSVEPRALRGDFALVYVSPEKLFAADGRVLHALARLGRARLLLLAVDEAHCVSEWGHDFRKEYQRLGEFRRAAPGVPIVALTATAVARVQADIVRSLGLVDPFVSRLSLRRANLELRCERKVGSGLAAHLAGLVAALKRAGAAPPATLVYCPTKGDTEAVCAHLRAHGIAADYYPAGRAAPERAAVHGAFLSSATPVVAATVAFGMGIDKPDIRKVYHFGAPKTVEEYYQQVGRAGRDGAPAECVLIASDADYTRYASEFYLGELDPAARAAVSQSSAALRAFAADQRTCRHAQLLAYFGESPAAARCGGMCDNCQDAAAHAGDQERDLGPEARVLLAAMQERGGGAPWSQIEALLTGGRGAARREALRPRRSVAALRELLGPLVDAGYAARATKTASGRYARAYEAFTLTEAGEAALAPGPGAPIRLAVPSSFRKLEEAASRGLAARTAQLAAHGLLGRVPASELAAAGAGAEGPVLRALLRWTRALDGHRAQGPPGQTRAARLEALLATLHGWRLEQAKALRLSPESLAPEHLLHTIALVQPAGADALIEAGLRVPRPAAEQLAHLVARWQAEAEGAEAEGAAPDQALVLCEGPTHPLQRWPFAKETVGKARKCSAWVASEQRFGAGDSIQHIAATPERGSKPILPSTVAAHLLTALQVRHDELAG